VPVQPLKQDLRLLASLAPDAHLRLARDGRWLAASPSTEALLGYTAEDLVGRRALDLVHPPERPDAERALRGALPIAESLSLRLRLVRRDGGLLRAELKFDAERDAAGAVAEHRVTVRDLSRGRAADELRAQWEVLFRVTRRGIAVTDARTHRIAAVNPAYAAMHGRPVEEFVGLPVQAVLTAEAAPRIDALADRIDESGFVSYESEHVRPDGSTFPAAVEVMAARDDRGDQLYWLAWVEDLTERRRADRDAERHAEDMARSHAELDRFAGVISHDLQSPMRVIAGCARILERRAGQELDEEQRELLEHIVGGVHRMTALLDGIREWTRARGGDAPMGAVDAAAAVDEARSLLEADLEAAGARVEVGALPAVHGHTAALVQLFQNLLANAVKFRGDAPPVIVVGAEAPDRDGGMWTFSVTDNGIGIEQEYADRVFEFGRRLHSGAIPGSGIGLTVCKTVVERHGGRIWVEPAPGGGSRFRFTLPEARAAD
jgi:PAS domain S-box-containing protein